ncbi:transcription termination factor, RNA polymerase II S homeolog [Xenopus laevis]|uniref:Transcription termination factor 2 n=1 Tax=Xenopus laevis TaxID=8355 RepID=Q6NRX8_XENLA|nr:transcription termination factor, RNA polymerase II S homeolog [Xenopus laevis]AAH70581.1 MGC81081 protein [Xenopus laevis]
MEKVRCKEHGTLCLLKTGTRDGPNRGKSFYVCTSNPSAPCLFTQSAELPASHCLLHEDFLVELQAIVKQESGPYRLYYRCVKSKSDGKKWCGYIPWQDPKQKTVPNCKLPQHSMEKPERNPFKVINEDPKIGVWKRLNEEPKAKAEITKKSDQDTKAGAHGEIVHDNRRQGSEKITQERKASGEERRPVLQGGPNSRQKLSADTSKPSGEEESHSASEAQLSKSIRHVTGEPKKCVEAQKEERSLQQGWRDRELPGGMKVKKFQQEFAPESDGKAAETPRECELDTRKSSASVSRGPLLAKEGKASDSGRVMAATDQRDSKTQTTDTTRDSRTGSQVRTEGAQLTENHTTGALILQPELSNDAPVPDNQEEDGDDVVFVSSLPANEKAPSMRTSGVGKQRTITSFPGFSQPQQSQSSAALHSQLSAQLQQKKATMAAVNLQALPDRGVRLLKQVQDLEDALSSLSLSPETSEEKESSQSEMIPPRSAPANPFSKPGPVELARGVKPLSFHELPPMSLGLNGSAPVPSLSQNFSSLYKVNPEWQTLYGGRMTEERLFAVRNATSEAIEHLHKSLESCPSPENTVEDPAGLKVPLLLHQKQALAWLRWRENQTPRGGILADDMGLGKTLTMVALILMQKQRQNREQEKKLEEWISKTDSTLVVTRGTLIVCPASLVHHWKKEVEKRVAGSRLKVYLYHGPSRERDCSVLADYDIVVTTYSLVSKEIPVKKEEGDAPAKDQDLEDKASSSSPLLRMAWARIILDEAHNIKNPKVQTSIAVCKLRAGARWAVTGTPIQNNLLDMYSLLRFLRCSPFDEFKLWKNQVDNGSRKGGERLNILTKSLLLRRTKDQMDHLGRPLVLLPQRRSELHKLTLSDKEKAVYDVIFARSRSTLQNYLKRHEGGTHIRTQNTDNPFERVANEFGSSQSEVSALPASQGSSTVHILSLLLRLRQCCGHLSLLKVVLEQLELKSEGLSLTLEEQLSALSLTECQGPDPKSTVSLNGTNFPSELFDTESQSTKISSLVSELKTIRSSSEAQKSVIVSQWTSMLKIVAVHLKLIGLSCATIDGSVNPKQRMDMVEDFNNNPKGPQVMLVSLCAGGVGLNLVGGNHLFLMDMHWNPALEDQACDRIYRVGQQKDVVIHRFVCLGTVEEKISQLQEKKKDLAKKVLSGNSATFTKLTLADLRLLFGV